jgi:hypothetical protein
MRTDIQHDCKMHGNNGGNVEMTFIKCLSVFILYLKSKSLNRRMVKWQTKDMFLY